MISTKTLVRLGLSVNTNCAGRWVVVGLRHQRVAPHVHHCVGDSGHGGKHVCPCGALRPVSP